MADELKPEEKIERLTKIIEENPEDAEAYFDRGNAYYALEKYDEAIQDYNRAIELEPDNSKAQFRKGVSFVSLEKYLEAISCFDKIKETSDKYFKAQFNKGVLFVRLEKDLEAISCFNEIKETSDKYFEAQFNKGVLFIRLEKYLESISCFDKIKETSDIYFEAQFRKGVLFVRLENYLEAISCFNKIKETSDKYFEAQFNKGILFVRLEKYLEAISCFDKINETSDKYFEAQFNKGFSFVRLEKDLEAISCFNKIKETSDKYFEAQFRKGVSFVRLEKYLEAISCFNKIKETSDKYFNAQFNKGILFVRLEKYLEAISCFDKIKEVSDKYFEAQFHKGFLFIQLKKDLEAISCFDKIQVESNKYFDAQYFKGVSFVRLEKEKEAILCFDKIQETNDKYFEAQFRKGILCLILGNITETASSFVNAKKESFEILREFSDLSDSKEIEDVISKMLDYNNKDFFNVTIRHKQFKGNERNDYKKIYINALKIIVLLHIESDNETSIAHYTKRATAATLLFSEKSKFRLNSTITANDPQEGKTLLNYFKLIEDEADKSDGKYRKNKKNKHDYKAFIGCFTFNHESLNQFRLYGKEGDKEATGISLVLNNDFFNEEANLGELTNCYSKDNEKDKANISDDRSQEYALYRCIYLDPDTHKIISLGHKEEYSFYRENKKISKKRINGYKKYIEKIKNDVNKCLNKLDKSIKDGKNLDQDIICELLLPLRYLVKHVAYKEEQECRIFDIKDLKEDKLKEKDKRKVKFTADYAQMYIDYQPITDYVEKIFFAPKTEGVEIFKKAIEQEGLDIKCKISSHPFS